jgi:hypothetical protein
LVPLPPPPASKLGAGERPPKIGTTPKPADTSGDNEPPTPKS